MPATPTTSITYEQSFTLPENQFEEIVRGESRIMPPPSLAHNRLLRRLHEALAIQLRGRYEVLGPEVGLGILKDPFTYRIPDRIVFPAGIDDRGSDPIYIWEPPLLIVECLSPANRKSPVRDLLEDYKSIHVPEVWMLKPEQRVCEVYSGDNLDTMSTVTDGILHFGGVAEVSTTLLWKAFHR